MIHIGVLTAIPATCQTCCSCHSSRYTMCTIRAMHGQFLCIVAARPVEPPAVGYQQPPHRRSAVASSAARAMTAEANCSVQHDVQVDMRYCKLAAAAYGQQTTAAQAPTNHAESFTRVHISTWRAGTPQTACSMANQDSSRGQHASWRLYPLAVQASAVQYAPSSTPQCCPPVTTDPLQNKTLPPTTRTGDNMSCGWRAAA
jgi:hypothetical protein